MSHRCPDADAVTCRHLLVPLDETDQCMATVIGAIELARIAAARLTFVHVPRLITVPRDEMSRGRELLGKAESVARALGVPCASAGLAGGDAPAAIPASRPASMAGCAGARPGPTPNSTNSTNWSASMNAMRNGLARSPTPLSGLLAAARWRSC